MGAARDKGERGSYGLRRGWGRIGRVDDHVGALSVPGDCAEGACELRLAAHGDHGRACVPGGRAEHECESSRTFYGNCLACLDSGELDPREARGERAGEGDHVGREVRWRGQEIDFGREHVLRVGPGRARRHDSPPRGDMDAAERSPERLSVGESHLHLNERVTRARLRLRHLGELGPTGLVENDRAHGSIVGVSKGDSVAIKLYRCKNIWVKTPNHPCWRVQKALDEQGIEYELVPGPWPGRGQRAEIERLSGQPKYPVIQFEDGSVYREESKDMTATIMAGKLDEKRGAPQATA
jgi:hypothetical protein